MMTSAQVVEISVTITDNSPSQDNFGTINWVDNVNWPPLRVLKLTFRALALHRSEVANYHVILSHRRSTTVSSETFPASQDYPHLNEILHDQTYIFKWLFKVEYTNDFAEGYFTRLLLTSRKRISRLVKKKSGFRFFGQLMLLITQRMITDRIEPLLVLSVSLLGTPKVCAQEDVITLVWITHSRCLSWSVS